MVFEDYSGQGVEMRNAKRRGTNLAHFNGRLRRPISEEKISVGDVIWINGRPEAVCEVYRGWGANRHKRFVKNAQGKIIWRIVDQPAYKYKNVMGIPAQ